MPDPFLRLTVEDQREALSKAADLSGRPEHLLEKDVWVVWALNALFDSSLAQHLAFKGGTSLSKGYGVINRFSEDIDLTVDIRQLIPDLVSGHLDALPTSRSQADKWSAEVRTRLPEWLSDHVVPLLQETLKRERIAASIEQTDETLILVHEPIATGTGYVDPRVMLEFGGRAVPEPNEAREVTCDAAPHLPMLAFPKARPRVMLPERTFWEKATAAHVYCLQQRLRGHRMSRHWHDLTRLDRAGIADRAAANRKLGHLVAHHKQWFFREKGVAGDVIDYQDAVSGNLILVPSGKSLDDLADDYNQMVGDGLLLADAEQFDELIASCEGLQEKINRLP